jgi:hypothetical protein
MEAVAPVAIFGIAFLLFAVPRLLRQKAEFDSGSQPIQQALEKRRLEKVAAGRAGEMGVDIRVLGLKKMGAGYELRSWRGDKVVVPLESILRHPENFKLDEAQQRYVKLWQQENPIPDPTHVFCRGCGADTMRSDHKPDCPSPGVFVS